jgi:hypothetical protein
MTTAGGQIFSSWDFRHWQQLQPPQGKKAPFHGGECPRCGGASPPPVAHFPIYAATLTEICLCHA